MEGKFVTFFVVAIAVGVASSVFGEPGSVEDPSCQVEFLKNPIFDPFKDIVEGIYKILETTRPNEYLEIENNKCGTYLLAQKILDTTSAAVEIVNGKDCSRISEIDELEGSIISDADKLIAIFYSTIRLIVGNEADFATEIDHLYIDHLENKSTCKSTSCFYAILKGMKTVITDMCREYQHIQIEESLDLLNAAEEEVNDKTNATFVTIVRKIEQICDASYENNIDGKVDCALVISETSKINTAMATFFHNMFEALRNSVSNAAK